MGVVIPEGSGQATLRWKVSGDNEEMICQIGYNPVDEEQPATDADEFRDAWLAAYPASALCDAYTFVGVTCRTVPLGEQFPIVGEVTSNQAGTATFDCFPNNCAMLITKNTSHGGRAGKGRMYVPIGYIADNECNEAGVIDSAEVTEEQGRIDAFMTDVLTGGNITDLLLLHSDNTTPYVISSFTVQSKIATQRKRMRR